MYPPNFVPNDIPLIVHAPTNKAIKGSEFIADAIDCLKKDGFHVNFIEIYDMEHSVAMDILSKSDILIDQIIIGDVGVAAREGMALGKVVIGYLTPRVQQIYGPAFPVVVADRYTLKDVLVSLITNPSLMQEIRINSRRYAEQYHDCKKVAVDIHKAYLDCLGP